MYILTLRKLSKNIFLIACFFSISVTVYSEAGIQFNNGTLKDALARAKAERKYVFVHTTSTGCQPCQSVQERFYNDPNVANFYNRYFVNHILNADDLNNSNIAGIHNLGENTVLMYYNSLGEIVGKVMEVNTPDDLIFRGQEAIDLDEKNDSNWYNLQGMHETYLQNQNNPSFLREYAKLLRTFDEPYNYVVNQYLETQEPDPFVNQENLAFVYDYTTNVENKAIDYFIERIDFYKKYVSSDEINEKIKVATYNSLLTAINEKDEQLLEKLLEVVDDAHLPSAQRLKYYMASEYYAATSDWETFARVTVDYFKTYKITDPKVLNDAAGKFDYYVPSKKYKKIAKQWIEESIRISSECYNTLTYARILSNEGDCVGAIEQAKRSIRIAEQRAANGIPTSCEDALRYIDYIKGKGCDQY